MAEETKKIVKKISRKKFKKIEPARTIRQFDAAGQALGRLATQVALVLRGKDKIGYQPNMDQGEVAEVKNVDKLKFTGNKLEQKEYIWHSTHPGGLKRRKVRDVMAKDPGQVLRRAVSGMLPKNKLSDQMIKRLKIIK